MAVMGTSLERVLSDARALLNGSFNWTAQAADGTFLLKTAARKRGIAFLPIPPYSPHLSPVEAAIGTFKMMAGAVMLAACSSGGALTTEHAAFAATIAFTVFVSQ